MYYVARRDRRPRALPAAQAAARRRSTAPKACSSTSRFRRRSTRRSSSSSAPPALPTRRHADWRRIIVEKPFGTDLAQRARAQPARAPAFRRGPGLPHRSLPREGNRPEPDGVPLRATACSSRSGTAATSITCRSPRPRPSASSVARLLRGRRRAARHGAEPPDAAAVARRDGAADRVHRRERARSQDGRAAGRAAARRTAARDADTARRARAVRAPGG